MNFFYRFLSPFQALSAKGIIDNHITNDEEKESIVGFHLIDDDCL